MQETSTKRAWGGWFLVFAAVSSALIGLVFAVQIVVDPFGVWRDRSVNGFNHIKEGRRNTERMYKFYEYERVRPQVVIFGNSRGNWGFAPSWGETPREKVYNFGFDSQRIGDMERFSQAAVAIHEPRTVLFVINPVLLVAAPYKNEDPALLDRLRAVTTPWGLLAMKARETVLSFDALERSYETYRQSARHPKRKERYLQGWKRSAGRSRHSHKRLLFNAWRYFVGSHRRLQVSRKGREVLLRTVDRLRGQGVEVVLCFDALSAIFSLSIESRGKTGVLENAKRSFARRTDVWDFAYPSSVTGNLDNYLDASHYSEKVGRMMTARMTGRDAKVPEDFGVLLTRESVEDEIARQRSVLDAYKKDQTKLYAVFTRAVKHRNEKRFKAELDRTLRADDRHPPR